MTNVPNLIADHDRPPGSRAAWLACVFLIAVSAAWLLWRGPKIDTDILALLPPTERDPVVAKALDQVTRAWTAKTVLLTAHEDAGKARAAAEFAESALRDSQLFVDVQGRIDDAREQAYFDLYFPHRALLPGPSGDAVLQKAERALYSPLTTVYGDLLDRDPLFLFAGFIENLPRLNPSMKAELGWLTVEHDDRTYVLLTVTSRAAAFTATGEEGVEPLILSLKQQLEETFGAELLSVGVIRYATRAAQQARGEVTLITTGSSLAVLLIFLFVFRAPGPLMWSFIPIATGLITAFCITLLVFGRIHVITLGFGASLIGVCVDYNFHFFCERFHAAKQSPAAALRRILPAIGLGALTSAIGYAGLALAPFPGLRQMAVFSTTGLLAAFLTVVCLFGYATRQQPKHEARGLAVAQGLLRRLDRFRFGALAGIVAMSLLALIAFGLWRLNTNDDIRALQIPPKDLKAEEVAIKTVIGTPEAGRFLLIEGATRQETLEREEAVRGYLAQRLGPESPIAVQGVSQFVPSIRNQKARWQHLQAHLIENGALADYLTRLAFEADAATSILSSFNDPMPAPLLPETWLDHPASQDVRDLWLGATDRGFATVLMPNGILDEALLAETENRFDGVYAIDKAADVSELMARYRVLTMLFAGGSYLLILLVLMGRYGPGHGMRTFLPAAIAAAGALAAFGLAGTGINLFHVIALLLVLGIGIDYTIFMAESGDAATLVAVSLSYVTTCLSFGLLALSGNPVLRAFGITVIIGLSIALLLSPLARRRVSR